MHEVDVVFLLETAGLMAEILVGGYAIDVMKRIYRELKDVGDPGKSATPPKVGAASTAGTPATRGARKGANAERR